MVAGGGGGGGSQLGGGSKELVEAQQAKPARWGAVRYGRVQELRSKSPMIQRARGIEISAMGGNGGLGGGGRSLCAMIESTNEQKKIMCGLAESAMGPEQHERSF